MSCTNDVQAKKAHVQIMYKQKIININQLINSFLEV